jgi:hypothetical protein
VGRSSNLLHWLRGTYRTKATGHQGSLSPAQKVPDILCLACPSYLKLLQHFLSSSQLLKLPLYLPLLPVYQLLLSGVQAHVLDIGSELTGQDLGAGLFQLLLPCS